IGLAVYHTGTVGPNRLREGRAYRLESRNRIRPGVSMPTHQVIPADEWATWPDDRLLDLRICQLGVAIEGSTIEPRLAELDQELQTRDLTGFRPHYWLSDEWFTPDGVAGI